MWGKLRHSPGLQRLLAVTAALLVWQLAAAALGQSLLLPAPVAVAKRLWSLLPARGFLGTVGFSLGRISLGFLLGFSAAAALAVFSARWKWIEILLQPYIAAIKAVPVASFIILCLIAAGAGNLSVVISFLMVLPIVYTNLLSGLQSTDVKLLEMAKVFRLGYFRRLKYIYLPALRPSLLAAFQAGIGLAWKAGVAAEVIGIPAGSIGEMLYEAKVYLASADLFAWTVVIVGVSVACEKLAVGLLKLGYRGLVRR